MQLENIFLNEGRKRLQSPDRIDTLLPLTNSLNWLALVAVGLLVLAALVWSVFGRIVIKVPGQGLILDAGGVYTASALTGGRVSRMYVKHGQHVEKGDVIAMITTPDNEALRSNIQNDVTSAESKRDAENKVSQFNMQNIRNTVSGEVIAELSGIVDEVGVWEGDIVNAGGTICTIRCPHGERTNYGVLFVPAKDGKKITPGMVVQLTPSGTDSSLDGSLMGSVVRTSQYPISEEAMMARLRNRNLVQSILQANGNSCILVTYTLIRDENDPSGYLWTSKVGRHTEITAGSTVDGFAVVDRIPPLEKVFLKFSSLIRNR